MAGINPLTGQFDPYYYAPAPTTTNQTISVNGGLVNYDPNAVQLGMGTTYTGPTAVDPGGGGVVDNGNQGSTNVVPTATVDPYAEYLQRQRDSAYSTLTSMFKMWGIDVDGAGLASQIRSWVQQDKTDAEITMLFRQSDAYNKRFTGMADLIKRGQFMNEADYIRLESDYRNLMNGYNLPKNFYDSYDDFGRFIANGVSVKELDDRIQSAQTFLNSTDPAYRDALTRMYGVDQGGMLAYVLDGDKAQTVLTQQFKAASIAGAGANNGFNLSTADAEKYAGAYGTQFNTIGADQKTAIDRQMGDLGTVAKNQESLSYIDNEAYAKTDTLDAELLNDATKKTASERRALREKARFSGSSAYGAGSLSRSTGV